MSSAHPSSTLGRILRSASFRLTLFYAALFIASAGALFATVYVTATAAMQNDMAVVLRSEALQLAEVHSRTGLSGLAQQIARRMNFRTRGPIFYLLQAPNGRVEAQLPAASAGHPTTMTLPGHGTATTARATAGCRSGSCRR